MKNIIDLTIEERPREKLLHSGPEKLSDHELLAILLGSGSRGRSVFMLASKILPIIDRAGVSLRAENLAEVDGVGPAQAAKLVAALEFARRRIRPEGLRIKQPVDVMPLLQHFSDRKQEHFIAISLNGANDVIHSRVVSMGLVNRAQIHPREVFADVITDRACSLIVAHNHPSGELTPSEEDKKVTKVLKEAGELLGIRLLDHIIFGRKGFMSFEQCGML